MRKFQKIPDNTIAFRTLFVTMRADVSGNQVKGVKRMDEKERKEAPPSMEEVQDRRWTELLLTVLPFEKGTLWWVWEEIWKKNQRRYDQKSTREAHPGLCIRERRGLHSLASQVPMLHGTSKWSLHGIAVRHTSPYSNRVTYFGHLRTTLIPLDLFKAKREDSEEQAIVLNRHKPRLSPGELKALNQFMNQTGIYE